MVVRIPAVKPTDLPPLASTTTTSAPQHLVEVAAPAMEVQSKSNGGTVAGRKKDKDAKAPVAPPKWLSDRQIVVHALKGGLRSFLLAYAMRGGIAFLIKFVRVLSGRSKFRAALNSFFARDSLRFASMIGSFSLLWKLINNMLSHHRGGTSKMHGAISGAIAGGVSILFEKKETRMGIAQQFLIRGGQAGYNALKKREVIHLPHADGALFMFACASIMYAYIMQPETIPREYYSWMVKIARVPSPILAFNRANIRANESNVPLQNIAGRAAELITQNKSGFAPANLSKALDYIKSHGGRPPIIPCSVLHPDRGSCRQYNFELIGKVMRDIAPVYAALNFVPMLLLKPGTFVKNPAEITLRNIRSTFRSSVFLSVFIFIFQSGICAQRTLATHPSPSIPAFFRRDHKAIYYIMGMICSSSIFLEQKSRRGELAMYVLPKGLQSLWNVLYQRGKIFYIPYFDVWMSSAAMGILMSVYQAEPEHMSSLLFKVMNKVIGRN
ncbi:hypothetical protein DFJ77DRAFT_468143 [Powellomyces hirtus]|nr:hypothetical protein DFJ77DRAFT_468143 [Powellomyces hirtus]